MKKFYIEIKVLPRSQKNEIIGYENQYLKIKIKEPQEKQKANKEVIKFLAEFFHIAKTDIKIIKGKKSRFKKLEITASKIPQILEKLSDFS